MDITQIMITAGSVVGIVVVAVLAIVPTLLEIPHPDDVARRRRPSRHLRAVQPGSERTSHPDSDWHLAA